MEVALSDDQIASLCAWESVCEDCEESFDREIEALEQESQWEMA